MFYIHCKIIKIGLVIKVINIHDKIRPKVKIMEKD